MIKIFAPGVSEFRAGADALFAINQLLQSCQNESAYPDYDLPAFQGHPILEFSTRYFTKGQKKPVQVLIRSSMASGDVLKRYLSHKLVFTKDNIVGYHKKMIICDGNGRFVTNDNTFLLILTNMQLSYTKYKHSGPEIFRRGQLAEINCNITGVPTGGGKYNMVTTFCNLVYLGDGCNLVGTNLTSLLKFF